MKTDELNPCDNLRALCWQMLEAHDKRLGLTTGTMQSIEAEGQYEHADDGVKQILCDYGVYLAFPICEEVEQDYRNRFPFTQIPNDAFGTLIEYEEDDLEPEERYEAWRYGTEFREPEIVPLKEYPDWAQAAELSRLQPEIATIIRRLPRLWSLRCRRSGYRCVLMMHDMVEECIQNKEEAVQDSSIPVIRRLREYAWTLLELHDKLEALEPSRPASIEVDEGVQFAKWAIVEFLQVFGVTQARPILQDVKRHYRLRFPYTQIPTNAFETLIELEENELAPRRTWFDGRIADVSLLFDGRCLRWMNDLASEEAILP